jgi:hypothetical protein
MKRKIARELAKRLSGTVEVLLLWQPEADQVELSVHDLATDAGFHLEVAPAKAMDAFYHPYAYAAMREDSYRVEQVDRQWLASNLSKRRSSCSSQSGRRSASGMRTAPSSNRIDSRSLPGNSSSLAR